MRISIIGCALLFSLSSSAFADQIHATLHEVSASGVGKEVGTVKAKDTKAGLEMHVQLEGLTSGEHGFHMHTNPSCDAALKDGVLTAAWAAGPHFDPTKTGLHAGPTGNGHQGDLPRLTADADGKVNLKIIAPHLKEADLKGRSFMVHAGPDNYTDLPALGGGGARIMCGVIE